MKTINKILFLLIVVFFSTYQSCDYFKSKPSKDEYLAAYRSFMQDVQQNSNIFDSKDWNNADGKINDFAQTQYYIHEGELTYHDKLEIGKYPIMYYLAKYKKLSRNQVSEVYQNDAKALHRNLVEIMDTTSSILTGFDRDIRNMLIDFKREKLNQPGSVTSTTDSIPQK
ncbi:MAG: hypothetical protein JNM36_07240 [Chitinophagales bacterium]|nr:hypothetical protein [Chitinophagales bacterium]